MPTATLVVMLLLEALLNRLMKGCKNMGEITGFYWVLPKIKAVVILSFFKYFYNNIISLNLFRLLKFNTK